MTYISREVMVEVHALSMRLADTAKTNTRNCVPCVKEAKIKENSIQTSPVA